jgi:cytoplasmic iron level regulating protein YaaA (DUF328/UPF0246 family)
MLFLLSPAKTLDYASPVPDVPHTLPAFAADAARLIAVLRRYSPRQLASLMEISDPLAALNVARYQAWTPKFTERNARQAVLAFDGDVYDGLQARRMGAAELEWAQRHLRILSGLYGLLRPLDWMQPYRLEMGTPLKVDASANLYQYWGSRISETLNETLAADKTPVVINLASQEYSRAVDRKALKARVVDCVFEEFKGGNWKIISFSAKKARGLMARYAITHRVETPRKLEAFDLEGYRFDPAASQPERMVFRRRTAS